MDEEYLVVIEEFDKSGKTAQYYYHSGLPREIQLSNGSKIRLKWFKEVK